MECEDSTDNCSQICVEKEGGFSCACFDGFELLDNGASCQGTWVDNYVLTMYVCSILYIYAIGFARRGLI